MLNIEIHRMAVVADEVLQQLWDIHDGTRKTLPKLVLFHPGFWEEVVEGLVFAAQPAFDHE